MKQLPLDPEFEADFEALGKAAFGHRRKTVSNSLGRHPVFGPVSHALLAKSGIDGSRRAEALTVKDFENLTRIYRENFK